MNIKTSKLSELSPKTQETIEEILNPATPNLYLTPTAGSIFLKKSASPPAKKYEFGIPVKLQAVNVSPALLLDPRLKLAAKSTGIFSDLIGKITEKDYPSTSTGFQTVSVVAGSYECVERLLKPEKYNRWRIGFSISNLLLSALALLGNYFTPIKNASLWLLAVKAFVKVGDEIAEYNFSSEQKKELLKLTQAESPTPPAT